ncbi:3'(2'),5'-bisphosphate nucleotidase [Paenibacillus cellulosilyticus]|uniref:3'(2'),5'-bisphosphate nucleotidase CysQ n=1 Tax=Paenibacillus cellulosilyticus TaxID=375489 RepID=A0A2V2YRW0_9BACL|nr:3'(2'),5'-bisphosphate nucleotidase CysQ [Paenibacillus cellulosilyticus]PWW00783.1 3'(2'),5'-bisphosphate nucleotidase [Paenibacillus cellulosilyticus]QKS45637.1 3'(2'),5'-bisphosphate nucleotidase CysQ [Paenibacillus cellulosilyticus]
MEHINLHHLFHISLEAGNEILKVYEQDFDVEYKDDSFPLTIADQRAHATIMKGLTALDPNIPVLSEEGRHVPYDERREWERFWLVDPLDGTKEFIKKNGEFTVNIALIEGSYPSIGIIYAPVLDVFYFGRVGDAAYKLERASEASITNEDELMNLSIKLSEFNERSVTRVVASRSHMTPETEDFIDKLEAVHGQIEVVSSGSSLKFCLVAEGKADFYPRYAPTKEWDTGAGQAIVEAAGGTVTRYEDNERFYYNRIDLVNGWFLVRSKQYPVQ